MEESPKNSAPQRPELQASEGLSAWEDPMGPRKAGRDGAPGSPKEWTGRPWASGRPGCNPCLPWDPQQVSFLLWASVSPS